MKAALGCILMLIVCVVSTGHAAAQPPPNPPTENGSEGSSPDDGDSSQGLPGTGAPSAPSGEEGDVSVTRTATEVQPAPPLEPVVDAEVGSDAGLIDIAADPDAAAPPADDNCAEYSEAEYNAEGDFYYSAVCIKWRVCGGERVDDVVSGDIAGSEASGVYREYWFIGFPVG